MRGWPSVTSASIARAADLESPPASPPSPAAAGRRRELALALPDLGLHVGESRRGLLDIGREIREFLHLADFDHFILRGGAARGPFDRLLLRLHLDHPVAPQYLLRLGERTVGHQWLAAGKGDPCA